MRWSVCLSVALLSAAVVTGASARVCNLKVVSDSRPDFTDMDSLVYSATAPYQTTDEKCRAMWRWMTRCRRQTPQPNLHGIPVHDPIMFFNDFGYSFCSDYAALNCAIWSQMGLPVKLWDITQHTVSECFYDGRWHMFDNSLSAYYTLCDGKTVAGVEDIGKAAACAASSGKEEMGHAALYHCISGTSPNGFLSGCDTQRSLKEEGEYVFNPNRLQYRYYYNGFELGHRYQLNLRENEVYTRYARPLGATQDYYLPLPHDPEGSERQSASPQDLGMFGNGEWVWKPDLTKESTRADLWDAYDVEFTPQGMYSKDGGASFLISGANVIASATVHIEITNPTSAEERTVLYVTVHPMAGVDDRSSLFHREVLMTAAGGSHTFDIPITDEVAGNHTFLLSLDFPGITVHRLEVRTITQLNKLTLPVLTLGRNTIDVVAGDETDTIEVWPELQKWPGMEEYPDEISRAFQVSAWAWDNVTSGAAEEWHGCLWLEKPGTGSLVYAVETPEDMIELTYGGRFYNRAPGSSISVEYSTDEGKTWTGRWTLTDINPPWDTVHFDTAKLAAGVKRVLVRYTLNSTAVGSYEGCSIYSVRMNATYRPKNAKFQPLEVTYNWSELHGDQWVERSHTQLITQPKQRYYLSVGGEDIPRTNWIRTNLKGAAPDVKYGYSDGVDLKAEPLVRTRHLWGTDLAAGKSYTFSTPSASSWDGGDPDMTRLTDGVVASTYGGGTTYRWGPIWDPGKNPAITLDLGQVQTVAAVRIHVTGYPYDFYHGPFSTIEVFTSEDGQSYQSQGSFQTKMRAVDLDGDFLNQERGGFESLVFPLIFKAPARARYVQYQITNPEMNFDTSEIMVYDSVSVEEWREPLAMPLDRQQVPG
jgi:hypothetical protein